MNPVALRKRAGGAAVNGLLRGLSAAGKLLPHVNLERDGVEVLRDVPYVAGADAARTLDVYRPQGRGPFPTVLYVHGGGFRILSKDTHWIMGAMLARAGYLVFNINYRLAPQHPYPAALEDSAAAFAFVAARGESFGADLSRLAIAGESAGANLTCALTLCAVQERREDYAQRVYATGLVPRAVIPYCGILQVSEPERFMARRPDLSSFLNDRIQVVSKGYSPRPDVDVPRDLLDPLLVFERAASLDRALPPFLIPVGTKDPLIDDSRRLHAAIEALGGRSSLRIHPGEVHAFHAFVWRQEAQRCWDDTYSFLDEHLRP